MWNFLMFKHSNKPIYMQELLDLKKQQRTGTQLMQEIRKQADDVLYFSNSHLRLARRNNQKHTKRSNFFREITIFLFIWYSEPKKFHQNIDRVPIIVQARSSTISMPYRIQRIEDFVKQLESGDLKLRVRVLEVLFPPFSFLNQMTS